MWHNIQLSEIVSVHGGKRLPSGHDYSEHETDYKYLRVTDFFQKTPSVRELNSLNKETFNALKRYEIKNDDLYISIAGSIGLVGEWNQSGKHQVILTENAARLSPVSDFCGGFIAKQLNSDDVQRQIGIEIGTGGGVPKLALFRIEKLKIKIPDIGTQNKIDAILNCVDETIEKTEELIAKYEQIKQGMMHDLFTRGVDENGKLRPSYEDAPELYQETDAGFIPMDWEIRRLGDITLKVADRDHYTPIYADEGVPIISPKDFDEHERISFEKCKFITEKEHERNRKKTDLETGDIVFTRIGAGLGKSALVTDEMPEFSILHSACMIRIDPEFCVSDYFLYFLKYDFLQRQIYREIQSIGVPDLGLDKIKDFSVLCRTKDEQREISKRLISIDRKLFSEMSYLANLRQQKAGLMQDLLTGKVSVNVKQKEAA